MARTKAFEPAVALDQAVELFWLRGYSDTPLDVLVQRTHASRYGLYATFGGKRDLFLAVLERYSQAVMDPMLEPLEGARASAGEIRRFFERVFGVMRSRGDARGCLMCNAALEHVAVGPKAVSRARRHFDRVRRLLARALRNARRDGTLKLHRAIPVVADQLLATAAGAFLLERSGMSLSLIRRFVDAALQGLA